MTTSERRVVYRTWLGLVQRKEYVRAARLATIDHPELFQDIKTIEEIIRRAI